MPLPDRRACLSTGLLLRLLLPPLLLLLISPQRVIAEVEKEEAAPSVLLNPADPIGQGEKGIAKLKSALLAHCNGEGEGEGAIWSGCRGGEALDRKAVAVFGVCDANYVEHYATAFASIRKHHPTWGDMREPGEEAGRGGDVDLFLFVVEGDITPSLQEQPAWRALLSPHLQVTPLPIDLTGAFAGVRRGEVINWWAAVPELLALVGYPRSVYLDGDVMAVRQLPLQSIWQQAQGVSGAPAGVMIAHLAATGQHGAGQRLLQAFKSHTRTPTHPHDSARDSQMDAHQRMTEDAQHARAVDEVVAGMEHSLHHLSFLNTGVLVFNGLALGLGQGKGLGFFASFQQSFLTMQRGGLQQAAQGDQEILGLLLALISAREDPTLPIPAVSPTAAAAGTGRGEAATAEGAGGGGGGGGLPIPAVGKHKIHYLHRAWNYQCSRGFIRVAMGNSKTKGTFRWIRQPLGLGADGNGGYSHTESTVTGSVPPPPEADPIFVHFTFSKPWKAMDGWAEWERTDGEKVAYAREWAATRREWEEKVKLDSA